MTARLLVLLSLVLGCLLAQAQAQAWTFTRTNVPGVVTINDLAYGNGRFVATTGGRVSMIWSPDGLSWLDVPGVSGLGPRLLFIGGSFYAIGNGEIWRSEDGQAWLRVAEGAAPGGAHAFAATDGRGVLTAATTASASLLYSPDMRSFRPAAPLPHIGLPGTISMVSGVAHGAGRYFVSYLVAPTTQGDSTGYLVSTVDGTTWTQVTTGITTTYRMAGNRERFIAFVENRSLITTDGTTFSIFPLPFPLSNGDNLVAAGGRFFMSRSLVSSIDGLTWAPLAPSLLPVGADLRGFAYGRGRYVSAGFTQSNPPIDVLAYLNAPAPPQFASHPAPAALIEGQTVTLTASLDNPDTSTTFQWRRDGAAIAGATLPSYSIAGATIAHAGTYTLQARNALGVSTSDPAIVTVLPLSAAGRIVNLSVLTALDAGEPDFTVGFVVAGGSGASKPLLVRAGGPSLRLFGVATPHPDPRLELFTAGLKLGENDDWRGTAELTAVAAQVGAFAFLDAASRDAALSSTLPAGNHTARISSATGTTGAVIAEIYDATPAAQINADTPRLVNVSVLKRLAAGATLNAGFVIGGSTPRTVLIRAVGPSLAPFGVDTPLADPLLTLYQAGFVTPLALNHDWDESAVGLAALRATFRAVGAFDLPGLTRDAALLLTLAPGNYVAEAQGAPNTAGTVLVEIYEVP